MEDFNVIYDKLVSEGRKAELDRTKLAYLLGAVDALRLFCDFKVPEVEYFHYALGAPGGELIKCLRK